MAAAVQGRLCPLAYVNEELKSSYPMSLAGIGELRFYSQWAFKHVPLSGVPLFISWAFFFYKKKIF